MVKFEIPSKTRKNLLTLLCVRFPWSFHPVLLCLTGQFGKVGTGVCPREVATNHFRSLKEPDLQLKEHFSAAARFQNPENKNCSHKPKMFMVRGLVPLSLENLCEVKQSLIAIENRDEVCLKSSAGVTWIAVGHKMSRFSDGYILYSKNKYLFGKMHWDQAKYSSVAAQSDRACSQALLLHLWKFMSFEQGAGLGSEFTKKRTFLWPLGSVTVNMPNLKPFVSNSVKPFLGRTCYKEHAQKIHVSRQQNKTSIKCNISQATAQGNWQTASTVWFSETEWMF